MYEPDIRWLVLLGGRYCLIEEDLKEKATELGKEFEDIEEIWLLNDIIMVVGGNHFEILKKSQFNGYYVGHCRKNTSIHDQIEEEGVLLYKQ